MAIAVLFVLSLNVITGFCGQVNSGHAAFLGIGAYTSAMLVKESDSHNFCPGHGRFNWFGCCVASLRVRHDFLAITTMV